MMALGEEETTQPKRRERLLHAEPEWRRSERLRRRRAEAVGMVVSWVGKTGVGVPAESTKRGGGAVLFFRFARKRIH